MWNFIQIFYFSASLLFGLWCSNTIVISLTSKCFLSIFPLFLCQQICVKGSIWTITVQGWRPLIFTTFGIIWFGNYPEMVWYIMNNLSSLLGCLELYGLEIFLRWYIMENLSSLLWIFGIIWFGYFPEVVYHGEFIVFTMDAGKWALLWLELHGVTSPLVGKVAFSKGQWHITFCNLWSIV